MFKKALSAALETLWTAGFKVAGLLARPSVAHWSSIGGRRVLVLAPHPDDETLGCGGTIMRHVAAGDNVTVAIVTDGRRSRALSLDFDEMAVRRRQEAETAAHHLGVQQLVWLGLAEGEWTTNEFERTIRPLLDSPSPDILYAPSQVDFHPQHHEVANNLASLLRPRLTSGRPLPLVRIYPVQVPLTPVLANLAADVSGVMPQLAQALAAHASQGDNVARARRMRRYAAQLYNVGHAAEEFWQMTAAAYCRLHNDNPKLMNNPPFRSLRARAYSDPLAYLTGLSARRQLRRNAKRET